MVKSGMENIPLVSVVVPVFNSEKSIFSTLTSVAEQTYSNFEIIVVNDGCSDASESQIKAFQEQHPHLALHYLVQQNKGVSAARNAGLKLAKGKYIAFLDSDDVWKREKTELQVEIMEANPEIDLLACNRNDEVFSNFFNLKIDRLTKIEPFILLLKNFMITPTVLFKREKLNETGYFNEEMKHAEDYEFFIRFSKFGNCYLLNESLVITGGGKPSFGHSGLSSNLWQMEKGELKALKQAYNLELVSAPRYFLATGFSVLKFFRRWIVTKTR